MKKILTVAVATTLVVTLGAAAALKAAPLNRFTIGKSNAEAIDQAIACEMKESLASLDQGMQSSISDYREMSYVLAAAVHYDMGNADQADAVRQLWVDEDAKYKSGDNEEEFIVYAEHFAAYFAGKRQKASGNQDCS